MFWNHTLLLNDKWRRCCNRTSSRASRCTRTSRSDMCIRNSRSQSNGIALALLHNIHQEEERAVAVEVAVVAAVVVVVAVAVWLWRAARQQPTCGL